jgi:hypothetical protein
MQKVTCDYVLTQVNISSARNLSHREFFLDYCQKA